MGYQHRIWKVTCGKCQRSVAYTIRGQGRVRDQFKCECGATNFIAPLPQWPGVPRSLYIGSDKSRLFKLYPIPPEQAEEAWALPYSVRSFLFQASRTLGGCHYDCRERGRMYDETVFQDTCYDEHADEAYSETRNCHVLAGWSNGSADCALFKLVSKLCQTEVERNFLYTYLRYVKDRQFPMLIPQVRVGIAERRRPDFVVFVPLQYWNYKWYAVELDGGHPEGVQESDSERDQYLRSEGFEVISLRPNERGYLEEVQALVERIDKWTKLADTDPFAVCAEAKVVRSEKVEDDLPF